LEEAVVDPLRAQSITLIVGLCPGWGQLADLFYFFVVGKIA
jgi:hypothetical protein